MKTSKIDLSIIAPVFNEEININTFVKQIDKLLSINNINYEIVFGLDPSEDQTENLILELIKNNNNIKLITMSRRFGQPAATLAGLKHSTGNACIVMDVDLQDPPNVIIDLYNKYKEGYDVVYAKRIKRYGETKIKLFINYIGYKIINKIADVTIPENTGDFRIMSRRVVESIVSLKEKHGFLRGLVAYVGYSQTFVEYTRNPRIAGLTKYNKYTGSFKIGFNGIFAFSSKPLKYISLLGLLFSFLSIIFSIYILTLKIFYDNFVVGYASIVILITFIAGLQFLCLGIVGEYISRIYDEVLDRPKYIIDKMINFN